jgi:hypothetical protein
MAGLQKLRNKHGGHDSLHVTDNKRAMMPQALTAHASAALRWISSPQNHAIVGIRLVPQCSVTFVTDGLPFGDCGAVQPHIKPAAQCAAVV